MAIEFDLEGSGWMPYTGPIKIASEGTYALRFRARDSAGNVEPERTATVRIDKTDPLALAVAWPFVLWPPNGKLIDVDVKIFAKDILSGIERFILVSATSNDPAQTPDDIVGWAVGVSDMNGQLRAERPNRGRERIYYLTYEVADRAGNTARAPAAVLVPERR